jgi:hypothetical protein
MKHDEEVAARIAQAEAIERAVQDAVRDALRRHKRLGNPIVVWEDEQLRWIPPEEIPDFDEPAE